jgi:Zn-dependent protease
MNSNVLFSGLVQLLLLWLAISLHEASHAWAAAACGDPTAREMGRATLNPLRHLDLLGSLLFPSILLALGFGFPIFGWGRPTPLLEEKLRRPYRDGLLVLFSGSVANLLVAGLATVALGVAAGSMGDPARQAAFQALIYKPGVEHLSSFPMMFTLVRLVTINAFVAAFNLIPLPPLDGGQIALRLLPPDWAERLAAVRPYGFMIGVMMAMIVLPLLFIPFYGILSLVIQFS